MYRNPVSVEYIIGWERFWSNIGGLILQLPYFPGTFEYNLSQKIQLTDRGTLRRSRDSINFLSLQRTGMAGWVGGVQMSKVGLCGDWRLPDSLSLKADAHFPSLSCGRRRRRIPITNAHSPIESPLTCPHHPGRKTVPDVAELDSLPPLTRSDQLLLGKNFPCVPGETPRRGDGCGMGRTTLGKVCCDCLADLGSWLHRSPKGAPRSSVYSYCVRSIGASF